MSSRPERELKLTLRKRSDYLCLRDDPRWGTRGPCLLQTNHYFDAPDGRLAAGRILLRVREERTEGEAKPRCVATIKVGREVRPGYFDSLETEWLVSHEELDAALANPALLLRGEDPALETVRQRLGGAPLGSIGALRNERVERRPAPDLRLEVDRLLLPNGQEAYELEVETADAPAAEAWLDRYVVSQGITLEPARHTKMEQFRAALGTAHPT